MLPTIPSMFREAGQTQPMGDVEKSDEKTPAGTGNSEEYGVLDSSRAFVEGSLWSGFGRGQGGFSDGPYGIQVRSGEVW